MISGYTIEWTQHKSRKNKVPMPVRSECVAAIEKLIEITADLRDKCVEKDKDILLINTIKSGNQYGSEAGKICAISQGTFQWWLETFIRDNNIKDANGDYYNLTSHQFRRTLGTDMLSKGNTVGNSFVTIYNKHVLERARHESEGAGALQYEIVKEIIYYE